MFGGISGGMGVGSGGGSMFGAASKMFGGTGPLSFGGTSKNQPDTSVVPSPPREEGRLNDARSFGNGLSKF